MSKSSIKLKIVILTTFIFLFIIPNISFAYSPNNTHPDLTKEMAELYNLLEKDYTFSQKDVDWMKVGAKNEDKPVRWINHFYDPVHKIGWDGSNFGNLSKEQGLAQGEDLAPMKLLPSIEWVVNQEYQATYGSQYGNRTWQRALHSYIDGDEEQAFVTLGHILHLVEDLSVPDHTRNDPHSGLFGDSSSPYEDYAKEYTNSNALLTAEKLFLEKVDLMNFNKVQDAFEYMAYYSNSNFFSADTINNKDYEMPNIERLDIVIKKIDKENFKFIYNKNQNIYLAVKDSSGNYFLKDENFVLPSYTSHLFPKAVLVGASVVDLFFKEVEKYKMNPELLEPLIPDSHESIAVTIKKSPKIIVLNTANFVDDTVVGVKIATQNAKDKIVKSASGVIGIITDLFSSPTYGNDVDMSNIAVAVKAVDPPKEEPKKIVEPISRAVLDIDKPISRAPLDIEEMIIEDEKIEEQATTTTTEKTFMEIYESRIIPVNTPFFGGGGGGSNNVLPEVIVEEEEPETPIVILPNVSLTSVECQNTLAVSGCLVATTTLNFSWSYDSDDLDYYILDQNGVMSTTTATSTTIISSNNLIYIFSVSAKDSAGNVSATSTQEVEIMTNPVVINEVAWAGTATSSSDEWIELYNTSSKSIDLSQWVFMAEDEAPYISLSGVISAKGYYLIERTDDSTVNDIEADLFTPFSGVGGSSGLENNGEHLFLLYINNNATTTIDEIPLCNFSWCGGLNSPNKYTMERYDPYILGSDTTNWGTTIGEFILNGSDAEGNAIKGTPKAKNSISYQITNGIYLSADKTLTQENSPYLIGRDGFTVNDGVTLTLEEGVVVKIVNPNNPSLIVRGNIVANGTQANPVVITAFADDEYGGDMNNNATSTVPVAGSWKNITINSSSIGSLLTNTIIRYGGMWFNSMSVRAMVIVDTADVNFQNVTIEHSKKHGLHLTSSASTITNSTFQNNNTDLDSAGLYAIDGSSTISNNTFKDNKYGMFVSSSPNLSVFSNTFTNNSIEAVYASGAIGVFYGNTGSDNGTNAIVIGNNGNITNTGNSTTTLGANSLSYLIKNEAYVVASTTLAFGEGVIIKGYNNTEGSAGRIIIKNGGVIFKSGSSVDGLVFTSINDDTVGNVTDSATTSPSAGDWYGIDVENGGMLNMSGFTMRYAGGSTLNSWGASLPRGGIKFAGGSSTSTITNALFDNNYQNGIRLENNTKLTVSDTTFKNHTEQKVAPATAVWLSSSNIELQNIIFENNSLDISTSGVSTVSCINCGTPITNPVDLLP